MVPRNPGSIELATKSFQDDRYRTAIGELKYARVASRTSQTDLATRIGRSQQFVSKYESFERRLDVIEFVQIARVLDANWKEILDRLV